MTAITVRAPLDPAISDRGYPSLQVDPAIDLPQMPFGLAAGALSPRQQQIVGVISEANGLTDAARLLRTGLSGFSASVRSIAARLGLARLTELVTLARRHAVLDAAGKAICGLDTSYLWARAMPAAEFLARSERGLPAEPPPSPSGSDVSRSLRKPVELPPEEVYDSVRAGFSEDVTGRFPLAEEQRRAVALEASGRWAGGTDHEINEPAQSISYNLAILANIWAPGARAWSCQGRT